MTARNAEVKRMLVLASLSGIILATSACSVTEEAAPPTLEECSFIEEHDERKACSVAATEALVAAREAQPSESESDTESELREDVADLKADQERLEKQRECDERREAYDRIERPTTEDVYRYHCTTIGR